MKQKTGGRGRGEQGNGNPQYSWQTGRPKVQNATVIPAQGLKGRRHSWNSTLKPIGAQDMPAVDGSVTGVRFVWLALAEVRTILFLIWSKKRWAQVHPHGRYGRC